MQKTLLGILIAAALPVGCATSREPSSGAGGGEGDAQLRAAAGATIVSVDDKHIRSGETMNTGSQTVSAPVGSHKIGVYISSPNGSGEWTVPMTLQAGHVYRFEPASPTALSLRVIDETMGQQVAGPSTVAGSSFSAPSRPQAPSARP